jgi:hypothetical protein
MPTPPEDPAPAPTSGAEGSAALDPVIGQIRLLTLLAASGSLTRLVARTGRSRRSLLQQLARLETSIRAVVGDPTLTLLAADHEHLTDEALQLDQIAVDLADTAELWNKRLREVYAGPHPPRVAGYPAHIQLLAAAQQRHQRRAPAAGASAGGFELVISDSARHDAGESLLSQVGDGSLDLAIAPRSVPGTPTPRERRLHRIALCDWRLIVARVVDARWDRTARRRVLDVTTLTEPLLASPVGHRSRGLLEEHAIAITQESESTDALIALAAAGLGAALLPADAVPVRLLDGVASPSARDNASSGHWPLLTVNGSPLGDGFDLVMLDSRRSEPALQTVVADITAALPAFLSTSSGLQRAGR